MPNQLFVIGVIQPDNTVHGGTAGPLSWPEDGAKRHVYDQEQGLWLT